MLCYDNANYTEMEKFSDICDYCGHQFSDLEHGFPCRDNLFKQQSNERHFGYPLEEIIRTTQDMPS